MKIEYAAITDIGKRSNNEDAYAIKEVQANYLFAVADGLGAHTGSELASQFLCAGLSEYFQKYYKKFNGNQELHHIITSVQQFVAEAYAYMSENLRKNLAYDARTTLAFAILNKDRMILAHLGDSRVYHFTENEILWRSTDHSLAQQMLLKGDILESELDHHPTRNILLKCYGPRTFEDPSITVREALKPHEAILICSDGFWENMNQEDLSTFLVSHNLETALEEYVQNSRETVPALDNLTAICARR